MLTCESKAQYKLRDSLKLYEHHFVPHTYIKTATYENNLIIANNYSSSVLQLPAPILTYKGNKKGFDIYQATPDNMFVIKPDSSVAFNMPVQNSYFKEWSK